MISEKIVVIDNDQRIIKSIRLGLSEYEIIGFTDPKAGMDFLRRPNSADLVILDYRMPKIDGISVLVELKEKRKNIIVIMMTAYGTKDIILQSLRHRADEFIEKPFIMTELKLKIFDLLQARAYRENARRDKNNQVERMKRFIERNYDTVSLDFIAEEMRLSPQYISRLFNDKNDLNYREYKLKVKMDKAKELLLSTHRTVSEIAVELGYQNPEAFMRMFKQMNNTTPARYRRDYGKGVVK